MALANSDDLELFALFFLISVFLGTLAGIVGDGLVKLANWDWGHGHLASGD